MNGARRVLGHRAGEGDEIEPHVRLERVIGDARLAGDDDERRALLAEDVIEAAQRVAETDAAVKLHDRRLLRRQRVAVGEQHQRRFLQPEHVLDGREAGDLVEQTLLAAAGIAEHVGDTVGLELFQQLAMPGRRHDVSSCFQPVARQCGYVRVGYQPQRRSGGLPSRTSIIF